MKNIAELSINRVSRPIKVLQFGEGNFLRAFTDYMIDILNEKTDFNGNVAIVKPIPFGNLDSFKKQNNLYTVVLRGRQNGEVINQSRIITCIEKAIDPFSDYDEYISLAKLDSLRFVISNTTEAGISLDESDSFEGLPKSYPGKLTKFMYERYCAFNGDKGKGLIILPVELIEDNGKKLLECVLSLCDIWKLPAGFKDWVKDSNIFCNTLVDRIVTGYPKGEAEEIYKELGYEDLLLDVGEPFGLWVIESDRDISGELPFDKAGLPVVFTDNQKPYRERKVRVLNGAHTSSVLVSYLGGIEIVRDMMNDSIFGKLVRNIVDNEIVPCVPLPLDEVKDFANSVYERFDNPFIDHQLLSISLNSVSKWKARVLPSFKDYYNKYNTLPKLLTFSFASLLAFYTGSDFRSDGLYTKRADGTQYVVHDNEDVLKFFAEYSTKPVMEYVEAAAKNTGFWGEDLSEYTGFCDAVAGYLADIRADVKEAVIKVLGE
ncbi:MAG TPA: tagaturonate reductase [Clostridiales bacterium]|nr:tagaturonate reductase [Clostridiales bacterium]